MGSITVEALKKPIYHGMKYKRFKKFKKEKDANEYADGLKTSYGKRYPPIVEKVKIGMKFGYWYYVCIPHKRIVE